MIVRSDDTTTTVSLGPTGAAISKPRDLPGGACPHILHDFFPFPATTGVGTATHVGTASSTVFPHPCTHGCQCDLPDTPSTSHSPPGHHPVLYFHQALSLAPIYFIRCHQLLGPRSTPNTIFATEPPLPAAITTESHTLPPLRSAGLDCWRAGHTAGPRPTLWPKAVQPCCPQSSSSPLWASGPSPEPEQPPRVLIKSPHSTATQPQPQEPPPQMKFLWLLIQSDKGQCGHRKSTLPSVRVKRMLLVMKREPGASGQNERSQPPQRELEAPASLGRWGRLEGYSTSGHGKRLPTATSRRHCTGHFTDSGPVPRGAMKVPGQPPFRRLSG